MQKLPVFFLNFDQRKVKFSKRSTSSLNHFQSNPIEYKNLKRTKSVIKWMRDESNQSFQPLKHQSSTKSMKIFKFDCLLLLCMDISSNSFKLKFIQRLLFFTKWIYFTENSAAWAHNIMLWPKTTQIEKNESKKNNLRLSVSI